MLNMKNAEIILSRYDLIPERLHSEVTKKRMKILLCLNVILFSLD